MRTKIAIRNLVISQAIILSFLLFAYLVWFPHSFSDLGGFKDTALMLIFVDLILGPLLVFIIYKKDKKYLLFDINVLLAIQLGAFIYGAYSLYLKHPAYAVFNGNQFVITNVSQVYPQPSWQEQLKTFFFASPNLVITKPPEDADKKTEMIVSIMLGSTPRIESQPEYYKPFKQYYKEIPTNNISMNLLFNDVISKNGLKQFLKMHGGSQDDYDYFPLTGNNKKEMVWAFKRGKPQPIGIIESTIETSKTL